MAGGIARNDEALSILDNRRTRTIIVDELEVVISPETCLPACIYLCIQD